MELSEEEYTKLLKFYNVTHCLSLADAQNKHIEKLQDRLNKLEPKDSGTPLKPRG